jgi:hypothetical protein
LLQLSCQLKRYVAGIVAMARLLGPVECQGDVARCGRDLGKGGAKLVENLCLQWIGHGRTNTGIAV